MSAKSCLERQRLLHYERGSCRGQTTTHTEYTREQMLHQDGVRLGDGKALSRPGTVGRPRHADSAVTCSLTHSPRRTGLHPSWAAALCQPLTGTVSQTGDPSRGMEAGEGYPSNSFLDFDYMAFILWVYLCIYMCV